MFEIPANCLMTAPLTLELDERVVGALDELAAKTDQNRDRLVERAIEDFVAVNAWQIAKIEAGIAAADRGDFVEDDELARLRTKFAAAP